MADVTFEPGQLAHLTDIFMAGAHADDTLDGREVEAVRTLLVSHIKGATALPADLNARMDAFKPATFDVAASVKALGNLTSLQRRAVLEMLAGLSEADEEIDLAEDEFLRTVASAMGATKEETEGLTLEIEIVVTPARKPPPLPAAARKQ